MVAEARESLKAYSLSSKLDGSGLPDVGLAMVRRVVARGVEGLNGCVGEAWESYKVSRDNAPMPSWTRKFDDMARVAGVSSPQDHPCDAAHAVQMHVTT